MVVGGHHIIDMKELSKDMFDKYSHYAHSCMNKPNLAMILGIEYNPEPVKLRAGDALITVQIKGGKLSPYDKELPEDVVLEFYCYNVYSPSTHVIIEKESIKMEE